MRSHRKCFLTYMDIESQQLDSASTDKHMLIMEDDCVFHSGEPYRTLNKIMPILEKRKWTCVYMGHTPLGPILPTTSYPLCYTAFPWGAHCILWNRSKIRELLEEYPVFDRPWIIEGGLGFPLKERLATVPSICYQSRTPKEMVRCGLNWMGYYNGERIMMGFIIICTFLLVFGFLVQVWILASLKSFDDYQRVYRSVVNFSHTNAIDPMLQKIHSAQNHVTSVIPL